MIKITKETMDLWVSIKKHYCGCIPDIPAGYEAVGFGFGALEPGYFWLDAFGIVRTASPTFPRIILQEPRIILRKLQPLPPSVLSATITSDEVYPSGYEVPEGYKVLGFGRKDEFPAATHFIGVEQATPARWASSCSVLPSTLRRILLEKL